MTEEANDPSADSDFCTTLCLHVLQAT